MKRATSILFAVILAATLTICTAKAAHADTRTRFGATYNPTPHPQEHLWAGRSQARIFDQGAPRPWGQHGDAQRAYNAGARTFWWSYKTGCGAPGCVTDAIDALIASVPDDVRLVLIYFHEPESDVKAGELTIGEWKTRTVRYARYVTRHHPGVETAVCMAGWGLLPESGRDITDYDLTARQYRRWIDVRAFDAHVPGPIRTAVKFIPKLLREKRRLGLPLAILETHGPRDQLCDLRAGLLGKTRAMLLWYAPDWPVDPAAVEGFYTGKGCP